MNEEKENKLSEIDEKIILAIHYFGPLSFKELDSYINKRYFPKVEIGKKRENKLIKYFERKLKLILYSLIQTIIYPLEFCSNFILF